MQNNEKKIIREVQSVVVLLIVMAFVLMGMSIYLFGTTSKFGVISIVALSVYNLIVVLAYMRLRPTLAASLVDYSLEQGKIQKELLRDLAVPYAILDTTGHIMWSNAIFNRTVGVGEKKHIRKAIDTYFPELTLELFRNTDDVSVDIVYDSKNYNVVLRRVDLSNVFLEDSQEHKNDDVVIAMYMFDVTELKRYQRENADQKLYAGLANIDNYDEVMEKLPDVKQSLLMALVDRKINVYLGNLDAIVKRVENDKYFFVFRQKHMKTLRDSNFSLLDEVKSINVGNGISMTLSIGVGTDDAKEGSSFAKAYENARTAIGLALGRGGDQAAVKSGEQVTYYGGKSAGTEKTTRVKARVKAQAFEELLQSKDRVIIMAHQRPDADAFGSAIGIYRLVNTLGKKGHIVLNEVTEAIRPVANSFKALSSYDNVFVNSEQAIRLVGPDTMLVVCDVNRPSITECQELLDLVSTVVVFDHHRQSNEAITKATLAYIEPFASSACEMITEMFQYISARPKLTEQEADAMYAGILVDTDHFLTKTGVRTFEAASYLRKSGADMVRVRKMFRSTMDEMKAQAQGIGNAEVFMDVFAMSYVVADPESKEAPTVAVAKAANKLLDVDHIKASFVVTEAEDGVLYVSARSVGDVNVQLVMERFNGGGHANVAGVQLAGVKKEDFFEQLRNVLAEMSREGQI